MEQDTSKKSSSNPTYSSIPSRQQNFNDQRKIQSELDQRDKLSRDGGYNSDDEEEIICNQSDREDKLIIIPKRRDDGDQSANDSLNIDKGVIISSQLFDCENSSDEGNDSEEEDSDNEGLQVGEYIDADQEDDGLATDSFYSDKNEIQSRNRRQKDYSSQISVGQDSRNKFLVPPPNPLLPKRMQQAESVRTGFCQKLIDIKKPHLMEKERAPYSIVKVQKDDLISQPVKQQLDETNPGQETSLRHFFYLEFRKNLNGEKNPIVYNRFGKLNYDSEEKFKSSSFSQLIRTCNLKKLAKGLPGDMNTQPNNQAQPLSIKDYLQFKEDVISHSFQYTYQQIPAPSRTYYIPKTVQDNTLIFESRFESGNLQLAHKASDNEYNLILQNDINSKGHTQWFYFRIQNTRRNMRVKFNLMNFIKPKSLFNEGMKLLVFSEKKQTYENLGWHRGGEDISYFQNNFRREHMTNYQRCYYTLSYTYKFDYDFDTVLFAYSQPYTYSDLIQDLNVLEQAKLDYVSRNTLCRTLAGNRCEYLTITNKTSIDQKNERSNKSQQKKGVVISARVHPGESNASWMMKGAIDFLVGDSEEAQILRNNFVFKIIPMLNPDGVINGNYRCSLAGCDLNRRWKYPSQMLHPTIFHTKKLIKQFAAERTLILFCDLHGHSRRKNIFMYGNTESSCPEATRIFPYLMSKIAGPHFSYDYSRFKVQKNKEQTARITMWRELKIPNIFTMEASFCGPKALSSVDPSSDEAKYLNYHFSTNDLLLVGKQLCQTLILYYNGDINPEQQIEEIKQYHMRKDSNHINPAQPVAKQLSFQLKKPQSLILSQKQQQTQLQNSVMQSNSIPQLPKTQDLKQDLSPIHFKNLNLTDIMSELKKKIADEKNKTIIREEDREGDSSGTDSDSEPSDDNLDASELIKILPQKVSKKKIGGFKRKRNQILNSMSQQQSKKSKDDQISDSKRDANYLQPNKDSVLIQKKRHSTQRGICDFKKPTKSFLYKYSNVGLIRSQFNSTHKRMRDSHTQTSDKEDGSDYELSAMERDILLSTGCKPGKLKKLRPIKSFGQNNSSFSHQQQYFSSDNKDKKRLSSILNENFQELKGLDHRKNFLSQELGKLQSNFEKKIMSCTESSSSKQNEVVFSLIQPYSRFQKGLERLSFFFRAKKQTAFLELNLLATRTKEQSQLNSVKEDEKNIINTQNLISIYPNFPSNVAKELQNFSCRVNKSGFIEDLQGQQQILTQKDPLNQLIPSKKVTQRRKVSQVFNQNQINNFTSLGSSKPNTNTNTLVPGQPANTLPSHLSTQLVGGNFSGHSFTNKENENQMLVSPSIFPNMNNQNSSSFLYQQKQLSPIVHFSHNRLQNCIVPAKDSMVLEKIEEKIPGQRSQSSNTYESRKFMNQRNRINELNQKTFIQQNHISNQPIKIPFNQNLNNTQNNYPPKPQSKARDEYNQNISSGTTSMRLQKYQGQQQHSFLQNSASASQNQNLHYSQINVLQQKSQNLQLKADPLQQQSQSFVSQAPQSQQMASYGIAGIIKRQKQLFRDRTNQQQQMHNIQ